MNVNHLMEMQSTIIDATWSQRAPNPILRIRECGMGSYLSIVGCWLNMSDSPWTGLELGCVWRNGYGFCLAIKKL